MKKNRRPSTNGLTFMEILVGLTIFALIFSAAGMLLHSMIKTHYTVETDPLFVHHTETVRDFLRDLQLSSLAEGSNDPSGALRWQRSPVDRAFTVSYRLDREVPFFVSPEIPLPPLTAYLQYERENNQLWLHWFLDTRYTDNRREVRYSLLSPWVEDIEYGYFDSAQNTWEFEYARDESRSRANQRPDRIVLIFAHSGRTIRRHIHWSRPGQQNLDF